MAIQIPISPTPVASLTRILDNIPKGYRRYTSGTIKANKIDALVDKFSRRHSIHISPTQRFNRKKKGRANALLTVYLPPLKEDASVITVSDAVPWLLQFTSGELDSHEVLADVTTKPRLQWLGYELVQHTFRGKTSWTWRRSKEEEEGLFGLLIEKCDRQQWREVERLLQSAASQPGFHGIREQTYRLCQAAQRRGYEDPIPHLYYMQKIKHGEPVVLRNATENQHPKTLE